MNPVLFKAMVEQNFKEIRLPSQIYSNKIIDHPKLFNSESRYCEENGLL